MNKVMLSSSSSLLETFSSLDESMDLGLVDGKDAVRSLLVVWDRAGYVHIEPSHNSRGYASGHYEKLEFGSHLCR